MNAQKGTERLASVEERHSDSPHTPETLAGELLNQPAVDRFKELVVAWRTPRNQKFSCLDVDEPDPTKATAAYFKLSLHHESSSALQALFSLVALIQANKRLDELKPAESKYRPRSALKKAYEQFDSKVKYKTFRNRLSAARSLDEQLRGLVVFLPFKSYGTNIIRYSKQANSRGFQKSLLGHPHYKVLLRVGEEFFRSVQTNGEFPTRIWEANPFGPGLPFAHQVSLFAIEAKYLPRSEYELDSDGYIVAA